ncbi:MAG: DUF4230 domain-containing protein [Anaerolineae bacterium]|nr:DUF4230 domain-containing protein [Anaerolineae bacterium]
MNNNDMFSHKTAQDSSPVEELSKPVRQAWQQSIGAQVALSVAVLGIVAFACFGVVYTARQALEAFGAPAATITPTPTPWPVLVVERLQNLGRLETVKYTVEHVVEAEKEGQVFLFIEVGSYRVLLVAYGEVVAGVDLSQVTAENVRVEGSKVTVELPRAQILSSKVDPSRTRIYKVEQDVLTGLLGEDEVDKDLILELLTQAEEEIVAGAREDGILQQAESSAQVMLTQFLRALGFTEVEIVSSQ